MRYCPFPEALLILGGRRKLLEMLVQQEIIKEKIIYLCCRETRWETQSIERHQRENPAQKNKQFTVHFQSHKLHMFAIKVHAKHVTILSNFLLLATFLQMFCYRRLAPTFKSCLLAMSRPVASTSNVIQRRGLISSTTVMDAGEQVSNSTTDEDDQFGNIMNQQQGNDGPSSYRQFLEEIGYKYKFASPQKWLGNEVVEFVYQFPHRWQNTHTLFFFYYSPFLWTPHSNRHHLYPINSERQYIGCIGWTLNSTISANSQRCSISAWNVWLPSYG